MENSKQPAEKPDPDPFRNLVTKVIRVPKEEVDKREAEYQREQAKKPKRGPKPAA